MASKYDNNSNGETWQSSSQATEGVSGRSLSRKPLQWLSCLITMIHLFNRTHVPMSLQGVGGAAPKWRGPQGPAPQDTTVSGELRPPREIQVFNLGRRMTPLLQFVLYGHFSSVLLHTTPASQKAAHPGPVAPCRAAPPNSLDLRGCAPKLL